jgi:hypothetical protein
MNNDEIGIPKSIITKFIINLAVAIFTILIVASTKNTELMGGWAGAMTAITLILVAVAFGSAAFLYLPLIFLHTSKKLIKTLPPETAKRAKLLLLSPILLVIVVIIIAII